MKEFWDQRYRENAYAYGVEPNTFFKQQIDQLTPQHILMPAEGEGRNAVYAAMKGWQVDAFDISIEGQKKALSLAKDNGVNIHYIVSSVENLPYQTPAFDALGLIYAHFPGTKKSEYHQKLLSYLRPGGIVIFEAFSKKHLEYNSKNENVGGPKDLATLCSIEEIKDDFKNFDFLEIKEEEVELHEGLYHNGTGSVIRFVGRKR